MKPGTKVTFTMRNGAHQVGKVVREIDQPNGKFFEVEHLNEKGQRSGIFSRRRLAVLTKA